MHCQFVHVQPWAKINFYLKILNKRKDGYHDLLTFMHPIALFDDLIIKSTGGGIEVNVSSEGIPSNQILPDQNDNIVYKAAVLFFDNLKIKPNINIKIIKRIPLGAGLGGGSSDAANTLNALNKLYGYPFEKNFLYELSVKLGMDVAFFLEPQYALCSGRGEIVERRYKNIEFWCVLINTGKILPTKDVYNAYNLTLTKEGTEANISHFAQTVDIKDIKGYLYNDLEIPAIKVYPEIDYIKKLLDKSGVIKSILCGSGSTVCGLVSTKKKAEEVMGLILKKVDKNWWIKVARSLC